MSKQLPKGCDYQGRHPEAAECCTEIGADQEDDRLSPLGLAWLMAVVFLVGVAAVVGNLLAMAFA